MQWTFTKVLLDNYVWVLYNEKKEAIVIDCGEAKPILDILEKESLKLKYILITHSHYDHINQIDDLRTKSGALVVGNKHFTNRLPKLNILVENGSKIDLLSQEVKVLSTPGHCADHIIYYFPKNKLLFCGDLLFSLGCGRVLEGTHSEMVSSLGSLRVFPKDTIVFPSHEYTKTNLAFTKTLDFFNFGKREKMILENQVTLPTMLDFEFKYNPFLNLSNSKFKNHVTHNININEVKFFTILREARNNFTY